MQGKSESLTSLGSLLREQGRLREAVLHCDAAIAVDPGYAPAWLERGFVLAGGGSMDAAADCYAQAASLDPGCAGAFAGLASIAARKGNGLGARDAAARALALDPGNAMAVCALASVEIEARDCASAASRLASLTMDATLPPNDRAVADGLLGDALDGLGETGAAFDAYRRAKAVFAKFHAPRFAGRPSHQEIIDRIAAALASTDTRGWALPAPEPIAGAAANHIFLLGYPRSGTTLVENILVSIPGVAALEERPTLGTADQAFLLDDDGMTRLATLDAQSAAPFRLAYWAKVAACGADIAGKAFVDMDPLKGLRLPIISRLFPKARVVIMRRDPRDVVWSCFHTNFALTSASYEFTTLERVARHYDALMRLTDRSLATLPLTAHVVRYDELIHDFDATTHALCNHLDLPWSPEMRNFDRTAKLRGVSTASAGQVRKRLYDGTRQWERYREFLAPVLPILQPWVERFGFKD